MRHSFLWKCIDSWYQLFLSPWMDVPHVWGHNSEMKAQIKKLKTCGPPPLVIVSGETNIAMVDAANITIIICCRRRSKTNLYAMTLCTWSPSPSYFVWAVLKEARKRLSGKRFLPRSMKLSTISTVLISSKVKLLTVFHSQLFHNRGALWDKTIEIYCSSWALGAR